MISRAAFYLACLVLTASLCFHFAPYRDGRKVRMPLFPILFVIGALAVLAYQATWQLAGFTRPEFVRFMERYNPRGDNAAHHLIRGSILDREGRPLAYTEEDGSGKRIYPYAETTAHVVGFRHPVEGLTGMENAADAILSGYGKLRTKEDFKEAGLKALQEARRIGTNVTLCVDADLQLAACSAFTRNHPDGRGAAVALDPKTGAILALYSHPSFDPNAYERRLAADPSSPLLNRALHGRYPSGSTFKTAIAALMVDLGKPTNLYCPPEGWYPPGARRPIRDHEYYSYERRGWTWNGYAPPANVLDLDTALSKSSNTYFAQGGCSCGVDAFNAFAERFAINERIPLYTNGAAMVSCQRGNIPNLGRGERRELSQLSIGQGRLLVTPLHMAMLAASFANGGVMMQPRLTEDTPVRERVRLFPERVARRIAQAMRNVVETGTARKADLPGVAVCGKTGTAQNPGGEDHAWFICFAPEENPTIAVAVVVENAGFGSAAALPIAVEILKTHFGL